jgi:hypothetical protein
MYWINMLYLSNRSKQNSHDANEENKKKMVPSVVKSAESTHNAPPSTSLLAFAIWNRLQNDNIGPLKWPLFRRFHPPKTIPLLALDLSLVH